MKARNLLIKKNSVDVKISEANFFIFKNINSPKIPCSGFYTSNQAKTEIFSEKLALYFFQNKIEKMLKIFFPFLFIGEKVDIHIMKDHPAGEWGYIATEVTDKTGRIYHTLSEDKALGYGIYPVKMVVRGDHTSVDFYLAVVPPKTECVVFSIDGSFTASVSVTGRDPKVRAGAVDVVRY